MIARLRRVLSRLASGAGTAPAAPPPAEAAALPPYGAWRPDSAWVARRRSLPATYARPDDARVAALREALPAVAGAVVAAAERATRHEFSLLGSGPFVPVDPDRPARDGYQPIDWYLDPVRGLRFPRGVPHTAWNLYEMRPGNADVKYPWELARCQHWVTLAQAFRLTGEDRFAREIARELDDFVEANPVGVGINWTCTMDVALRVVSWVVALDLARTSAALDESFLARAHGALFDHGLFIRANLENTYEVTSNHFLSNVVGLSFLGAHFEDLPEGRDWSAFARAALETEIGVQVLPDGADFESAVPYHRLVAELFLGCGRLADVRGEPLSAAYRARVRDMVDYLVGVLRPDGLMPQSGDADDGRLHVMGGVDVVTPQDPRHLLGPAAAMYDRPDWLDVGGDAARWEAAWWGLDAPLSGAPAVPPPAVVRLFADAGHAVARSEGAYLLVSNGIVGTRGFGNHKHNDLLAFEYHVQGVPLVVDPGSYVYTSDPAARNLFRGTGYHSTLMIDDVEQNEINPEWLFRMFEHAAPEHLALTEADGRVEYRGRHRGYERLPDGVVHERRIELERTSGRLVVRDVLTGRGRHRLRWHFHLAPGVAAVPEGDAWRLVAPGVAAVMATPPGLDAVVTPAWYSPSYGVRTECVALDLAADVALDGAGEWMFSVAPVGGR